MIAERYAQMFRWKENPFTFSIIPSLFVGYEEQQRDILASIESGSKFSMITGPTGSGKTTMLRFLETKAGGTIVKYLPKPPRNAEDWIEVFRDIAKPRVGLFGGGLNIYNLPERVNKRLGKDSRCCIFIDECHEATQESLEWMRTLTDQMNNLSIIMAGLPVFEEKMKSSLETLLRRIGSRIALSNLTRFEVREMIKRRIEHHGGDDIKPFTPEALDYVYERTAGFPRDVIGLCNGLVLKAIERNISTIDTDFIEATQSAPPKAAADRIRELPRKQLSILDVLAEGDMTPKEVAQKLTAGEYKTRITAIRAVNNLLKRLMDEGLVERKSLGRSYKYGPSFLAKTLMVKA
ncbi:MAG: AAA family ATPase [Candidatus Aenigmarchaeota archaeon]|nr:AAA family ATPase [Candidatus Aenigmarchaeota archaeon]